MDKLRITVIDHQTQRVVCDRRFDGFPVRIGRSAGNHVELAYPYVSAWHAEIRCEGAALKLHDLGTSNGLTLDGRRLPAGGAVPIGAAVVVTIGPLELRLQDLQQRPDELPRAPAPEGPEIAGVAASRDRVEASGTIADDAPPQLSEDLREHVGRLARLQSALQTLRPRHAALEAARRSWEEALGSSARALRSAGDPGALGVLLREFPARDRGSFALDDPELPDALQRSAVAHLASELLPGARIPVDDDETRRFFARVIDVLRVFAACAIELRYLRDQQASEFGVVWSGAVDPLAAMETPEDLLRYLLDWRDAGAQRSEELVRLFAAVVDHQRACVRAALRATCAAVASLAPAELERGVNATWPTRAAALWRHFEACHAALFGERCDHLTPAFRTHLARAYADALARAGVSLQEAP